MEDQNPLHYLNGKWDLYYHLPTDNNWTLSSYKTLMKDIDSVEKVIRLNEAIPDNSIKNSMLFLMRSQVTPLWEDPKNRGGGCFSFKVLNKQVYEIWKALFYALCGETLCSNHSHFELINGITISPKKHFCIIKIWFANCDYQDPNIFIDIDNLQKQSCLFKKHEPEF
jgi:hypothetical protein|tara:strand:- start:1314 stop:1817 length:504 start_codon:yes stop_codon:yes gene_type:complete